MSFASRLDAYILGDAGARNILCERHEIWWNEARHLDCPECEARRKAAQWIREERAERRKKQNEK